MTLIVHLYKTSFPDQYKEFLDALDPDIQITIGEKIPHPAIYDILVYPTPSKAWIEASPALKAVVIPWAGVPQSTKKLMKNYPGISLHNLHHNSLNTAEFGFALFLTAAKQIIPMDSALRKNDWTPRYSGTQAILLCGRTALILGFGEIGQNLGDYCLAFGMRVLATKKHPEEFSGDQRFEIFPDSKLHDLLPKADVVFIALPLTSETENLINQKEISLMPNGSILINVGRGPVVNQYALYKAVSEGHLRAAGSDVWYNYPSSVETRIDTPPADVPFGELENFVLSPHRAGTVEGIEHQEIRALADLLNTANRGQTIPNKVDLSKGY